MATCKIIKNLGTIIKSDKAEMKLQLISWNGEDPVYDLRIWLADGKAMTGLAFTKEELLRLKKLYKGIDTEFSGMNEPENDDDEVVLTKPKRTTKTKATKATKTATKAAKKTEKKEAEFNLVEVTEYDDDYEQAETNTEYTLADAKKKLDEIFKEKTSKEYKYIKEKLLEELKANERFIQNFMRSDKTLNGAEMYLVRKASEKGASQNCCVALKDEAIVSMMIEYFDIDKVG